MKVNKELKNNKLPVHYYEESHEYSAEDLKE